MKNPVHIEDLNKLRQQICDWAIELGFQQVGFSDIELAKTEQHLNDWLEQGFHGDMDYMEKHGSRRTRPEELEPHTRSVISVRMDYWREDAEPIKILETPELAYIAQYAQGRDYHKLIRKRLATLAKKIELAAGGEHRAFVDSAPVMERAIAEKAGLGWIGKNTMLINSKAGSWFFLGELYTSLPLADLPSDAQAPATLNNPEKKPAASTINQRDTSSEAKLEHCGSCTSCLEACPTQAFNKAWQLDARKCISYLTIEYSGSIPEELRPLMGNRIFGCDDCIVVCPWNKFSQNTLEKDFHPRPQLDNASLIKLFNWDEKQYLKNTEGSALRRIGYERWVRNLAIGLGNCKTKDKKQQQQLLTSLKAKEFISDLTQEHIDWAIAQQTT